MPTYEFGCEHCNIVFEQLYRSIPKKLPKSKKCPECKKLAERILSVATFKISGRVSKIGKSNVNQFYNEAIEDSKHRLKVQNTPSPYKRYKPNLDVLTKDGTLKKLSESELKSREQSTQKVGNNMNNIKQQLRKKAK